MFPFRTKYVSPYIRFKCGVVESLVCTVFMSVSGCVFNTAFGEETPLNPATLEVLLPSHIGNADMHNASISSDGKILVFESNARTLSDIDTKGMSNVYMLYIASGEIEKISTAHDRAQPANGASSAASISANGQWIAFSSIATNLIEGDNNGRRDIFLRHVPSGKISRISNGLDSNEANHDSSDPSISSDGRFIAFASQASNLVPEDTNISSDIFLADQKTAKTVMVSKSKSNDQLDVNYQNRSSYRPVISENGDIVVFESFSDTLVVGDTNSSADIFAYVVKDDRMETISQSADGERANSESLKADVTAGGRYVVFQSSADNLTEQRTGRTLNVFLKDRESGIVSLVSDDEILADEVASSNPRISASGRFVVFESKASAQTDKADINSSIDVFKLDISSGSLTRLSANKGLGSVGPSGSPDISEDGRIAVFHSRTRSFSKREQDVHNSIWLYRAGDDSAGSQ